MEIQSSFKLFALWMIRRFIFPVVTVCLLWLLLLPKTQNIPLDGFQWWSTIVISITILFGMIPFIYFLMIPKSITLSKHVIVLRYLRRNCSIQKSAIKKKSLIQSGRHPGALKISVDDHNSHMISLVAFSGSDREVLCTEIIGDSPSAPKKPTKNLDLDYADWLPERLLGSKFSARFWNWGTKISILIPLQIRSSSKRDGFIRYQRINAMLMLVTLVPFAGFIFLIGLIFLLWILSRESVSVSEILFIMVPFSLISFAMLSMIVGTCGRIKLLKKIKEDRTSQLS
ncbi:MAG TPA: hypothetical protein VIR63_00165 [Pontiella sp.]